MSEQQPLNNTSSDVAQIIEGKSVELTKNDNDLKQAVTIIDTEVEPKKTTRFQITSIESDCNNVESRPDESSYAEQQVAENVGVFDQNNDVSSADTAASNNAQPKKKISFQVTSIESTEGRSRGDSNGYDDLDELNESEFLEEEGVSIDPSLTHFSGNGNGTSRFKVVKIPRYDSKPYTRGRWRCWDFVKCPPPSAEHLLADLPVSSMKLNSDSVTDRGEPESVSSTRNLVPSGTSSGAVFKPVDVNSGLVSLEVNTRPNVGNGTKNYNDKSAVFIANEFGGNPGTAKLDSDSKDVVMNNSSGLENNEGVLVNEPARALTDEATLR